MTTTAVTVIERAAVALGSSKAEAELLALAAQSQSITAITNAAGRAECHAAAMVAKGARIGIEKAGKAARDDATAFAKAVIAEQARLVNLIEPEEFRLINLRDDYDAKLAREKAAAAEAERLRVAEINNRILAMKSMPMLAAGSPSATIQHDIDRLTAIEIDDSFKEFYGQAVEVKAAALQKLQDMLAAKRFAEEDEARQRAELAAQAERNRIEREELAAQRAEQARRDAEAKAVRDEEQRQLEAARAEIADARRLIAEANAAAEAKRIADAAAAQKVIDDAAAEERRVAAEAAAKRLHDLAEQQAAAQADEYAKQQTAIAIPVRPMIAHLRDRLHAHIDGADEYELRALCDFIDAQRQAAA